MASPGHLAYTNSSSFRGNFDRDVHADTGIFNRLKVHTLVNPSVIVPPLDHGTLAGLLDDDHPQYALLAGRAGGQTLIGGTGAGDDLTLQCNTGNNGSIIFSTAGGANNMVFDNATGDLTIAGTTTACFTDGTEADPGIRFCSEATGFYVDGTQTLYVSIAGGNAYNIERGAAFTTITSDIDNAFNLRTENTTVAGAAGNSELISIETGNATGAGADSGGIAIASGTSLTGVTGPLNLATGQASGGTSGLITMRTGQATGANSGGITIQSGISTTASSGAVLLASGTTQVNSGSVTVSSGSTTAGQSGNVFLSSGTGQAISGNVTVSSGSPTTGNSGTATVATGAVNGGAISGDISIITGTGSGVGGTSGDIMIQTNAGNVGTGFINIVTGSTAAVGPSGPVLIATGSTANGVSGDVTLRTGADVSSVQCPNIVLDGQNPNGIHLITSQNLVPTFTDAVNVMPANASVGSTDISGLITTNASIATQTILTFYKQWTKIPNVMLFPASAGAPALVSGAYVTPALTGFTITWAGNAGPIDLMYHCIG